MSSSIGQVPGSWSPDDKVLAFSQVQQKDPTSWWDIYLFHANSRLVKPFLNSQLNEMCPQFSPDGRWLAYVSNETGRAEVYVQPFPGPGGKVAVSTEGGSDPLWTRNQKQLFFTRGNQVWVVDIHSGAVFSAGKSRLLFELSGNYFGGPLRSFDVSLDGRRFLMVKRASASSQPVTEMILVQNWFEELKRLCPTGK